MPTLAHRQSIVKLGIPPGMYPNTDGLERVGVGQGKSCTHYRGTVGRHTERSTIEAPARKVTDSLKSSTSPAGGMPRTQYGQEAYYNEGQRKQKKTGKFLSVLHRGDRRLSGCIVSGAA